MPISVRSSNNPKAIDPAMDLPASPLRKRFAILSSPRSGSSMLESALTATNIAGRPCEYFHPATLAEFGVAGDIDKTLNFASSVVQRRTTANGYFGMKLHFNQLKRVFLARGQFDPRAAQFLTSFDYFVFLYRRDKIMQALSYVKAERDQLWNTTDEKLAGSADFQFRDEDAKEVTEKLSRVLDEETSWRSVIQQLELNVCEVSYEDLCTDQYVEISRVLKFLDLSNEGLELRARTQKIAADNRQDDKLKYLRAIGALP